MGKSNKQKAINMMSVATPVKQNYASVEIRVEKKMLDGKEVMVGCVKDYGETQLSEKRPLEKEYTTPEELKNAVSAAVDGLYKKVK